MKIRSDRFGEIEAPEEDVLHFTNGLIGFPDCTSVLLLDHSENSPFRWLQSTDSPELAFVVIDPLLIAPGYPMEKIRDSFNTDVLMDDLAVAVIATVPPAPNPITVNLVAPIAIDAKNRVGAQIILHEKKYSTRHVLSQEKDE